MLLSKIPGNRTVGFRRSKKGKRSTRSSLRVDPGFWSFLKLQEVGFSPYLSFTLILRVFRCFDWFKAVRGRLIGPKTWGRIVGIFLGFSVLVVTAQKFRGLFGCFNSKIFALNHELNWIEPGMAVDCGFTR